MSTESKLANREAKDFSAPSELRRRVLLYSMGALDEAHSPALPRDIDDHMARRIATTVAEKTGFYYKGNLPYCGDRVGEIARDWCPSFMQSEVVIGNLIKDVLHDIAIQRKYLMNEVSHVVIISAHGGNNFLKSEESHLSRSIGIPVFYILPFDGIREYDERYGELTMTHADIAEHSIAAYMGLINESKLRLINDLASRDPDEALRRWPTMAGLGGYRLFGGPKYDILRGSRPDSLFAAKRFLQLKQMIADKDIGKKILDSSIGNAIEQTISFSNL